MVPLVIRPTVLPQVLKEFPRLRSNLPSVGSSILRVDVSMNVQQSANQGEVFNLELPQARGSFGLDLSTVDRELSTPVRFLLELVVICLHHPLAHIQLALDIGTSAIKLAPVLQLVSSSFVG